MKTNRYITINKTCYCLFITISLFQFSCKKEWLDAKPNKSLVVPSTIADYQALLDNNADVSLFNVNQPALCETSSDDYYVSYASWQSFYLAQDRNAYIWAKDFYQGEPGYEWNAAYNRILSANIVLTGIEKVSQNASNQTAWNNVKGTALFYRAFDFFNLAQEFCKVYESSTASTDLGIPLKLTADINDKTTRATIQATYNQIINDLSSCDQLLPLNQSVPTRPSKVATEGLLARVFLAMSDFNNAYKYADNYLKANSTLIDFNSLDATASPSLTRFNKEVQFYSVLSLYDSNNCYTPFVNIDSTLYKSYSNDDLRKSIYFTNLSGDVTYNGYYYNDYGFFGGIQTDEIYLIRAECNARLGNYQRGIDDLNNLLITRWRKNSYVPIAAANSDEALNKILTERRKELIFRGLRWQDLRRLNKDGKYAKTLLRILNGQSYTLPPNDPRYVLPIPDDEIKLSGIQQNPR